jgi:hypothetical protein
VKDALLQLLSLLNIPMYSMVQQNAVISKFVSSMFQAIEATLWGTIYTSWEVQYC